MDLNLSLLLELNPENREKILNYKFMYFLISDRRDLINF